MFLDSDTARPLFDMNEGGRARAFECRLCIAKGKRMVTLSVKGMRRHQAVVHKIELQAKMFKEAESEMELAK
jgi:hypothetical protein